MRGPADKPFDPAVSALFVNAVHEELRRYGERRVGEPRPCPNCDGTDLRKNGSQREAKTVARLVTSDGIEDVGCAVQQYECKNCGRSFQGDTSELFYEGCDYARPVVDCCLFHAATESASACERTLRRCYGLQVHRETVARYAERFDEHERYPIEIAGHTLSLSFLSELFGDGDADEPNFVITGSQAIW